MSIVRALTPIGVVVAGLAIVVWLLLVNDVFLGPWLLGLLLFAHGWVHLLFIFPKPAASEATVGALPYPFDFGRSWLPRAVVDTAAVRTIGTVVMSVTFVLSVLAALATVGIIVPVDWWGALVMGAALSSTVMLVLFLSPLLLLGLGIDAAMVVLVLSGSWYPG